MPEKSLNTSYAEPFRKLVEQSADGMLVVDAAGCVCYANPAAASLLQRDLASLIGFQLGFPSVSEGATEIMVAAHTQQPATVELRAALVDWKGQEAAVINLRDVTARRRQEQEVASLNSVQRALLEVEELLLRERDTERALSFACQRLVEQRRYQTATISVVGEEGQVQWSATSFIDATAPMQTVPPREEPRSGIHRTTDKERQKPQASRALPENKASVSNKGEYPLTVSVEVVAGEPIAQEELELLRRLATELGHALRTLKLQEDGQRAEQRMRESEARFRLLFENSIDAIVVTDQKDGYVHVNDAACELFGLTRDQFLEMSANDLHLPEWPPIEDHHVDGSPAMSQADTLAFVRPDGTSRTAEYITFRLAEDQLASFLRDVTQRNSLEEQLKQAQKMEAVGRLAGGIAHDFNNLLTAIISFAGFVRDQTPREDPRRDDIGEVLRAADRASSLTRQLLAFSRRQPINPKNIDLNTLILEEEKLLRRTLGEDIEVVTAPAENLWPVFIDPGQFEQVLINLAVNARDAMPNGGRLLIETSNQPDHDLGDAVLLRVADTGIGMSDAVKARVFEPFFTTKENDKGTGLGLSMVYGLVTQVNGKISVRSSPGDGTCFEITLPRATTLPTGTLQREDRSSLDGKEVILVVEDERVVRRAAVRILLKHGYSILEASNGEEAIERFGDALSRVDLLLCDVVMPRMGGPQTTEALRAKRPELKVLYMTGYSDQAELRDEPDSGTGVLHKPFTEAGLLTRLRGLLDNHPPRKAKPSAAVG